MLPAYGREKLHEVRVIGPYIRHEPAAKLMPAGISRAAGEGNCVFGGSFRDGRAPLVFIKSGRISVQGSQVFKYKDGFIFNIESVTLTVSILGKTTKLDINDDKKTI